MHSFLMAGLLLLSTSYGTMTTRAIKALSAEESAALREGKGMGFALAAELNSYPGPMHVLEMAEKLKLTEEQKTAVEAARGRMQAAAVALGAEIIDLERQLDEAFASATIDRERLAGLTAAIAERRGRLRYVHLAAHLQTRAVLTPHQIRMYDQARGYRDGQGHHEHRHE
ncbi:MAG TPA: Spy/CpxP family protein refolding chaperone [Thermoanaerobaculia bacterium]|nr:Spy/CpxP family protein refolding chaperone [Thermoanaerobaculia bacterium]